MNAALVKNRTPQPCAVHNDSRLEKACEMLAELLGAAQKQGNYFGTVGVELHLQDGKITTIRKVDQQTIR